MGWKCTRTQDSLELVVYRRYVSRGLVFVADPNLEKTSWYRAILIIARVISLTWRRCLHEWAFHERMLAMRVTWKYSWDMVSKLQDKGENARATSAMGMGIPLSWFLSNQPRHCGSIDIFENIYIGTYVRVVYSEMTPNPQLYPLEINAKTKEPFLRLRKHKNIILTPPRWEDAEGLFSSGNDPRVNEWLAVPVPYPMGKFSCLLSVQKHH